MHGRTSYVHWYNHYKQVDPSRVVHNYSWVKSPFYPCNYIFHLVYDPIINQVPLALIRGWGPLFKSSNQYLREQLIYFSYMEMSELHLIILCSQLPIWSSPKMVGILNRLKEWFSPCKLKNKPSQAGVHNLLRIKIAYDHYVKY